MSGVSEELCNKKLFVACHGEKVLEILTNLGLKPVSANFDAPFFIIDRLGYISPITSPNYYYNIYSEVEEIGVDDVLNLEERE